MRTVKERLSEALVKRNISQASLAAILGVPRSSISNWMANDAIPTHHLTRIAIELNISIDWLIDGKGPMQLHGPQHISSQEKSLIESLRKMGGDFTEVYLQMIYKIIEPAYGKTPYESIGFTRFVSATGLAWGIVGSDGRIESVGEGLVDILLTRDKDPTTIVGTSVFTWISEEYISAAIIDFTSFLEGKNLPQHPKPFSCRLIRDDKSTTPIMQMYFTYELYPEQPKKNKIHVLII